MLRRLKRVALLCAGLLLLAASGAGISSNGRLLLRGEYAMGTVIYESVPGSTVPTFQVEFETSGGERVRYAGRPRTALKSPLNVGGKVRVVYDPMEPTHVVAADPFALLMIPAVIGLAGTLALFFGLERSRSRKTKRA